MATHKLVLDDFDDSSYLLMAIHCNLEDYRLAYLLNRSLDLNLKRRHQDIDFEYMEAFFPIFEWEDKQHFVKWTLVANRCKREENSLTSTGTLFEIPIKNIKTFYLIPEYDHVNFFLKIETEGSFFDHEIILDQINKIALITTAYQVDPFELKSRENLIFS